MDFLITDFIMVLGFPDDAKAEAKKRQSIKISKPTERAIN